MNDLLPIRIVKIGGSLIPRRDLPSAIDRWVGTLANRDETLNLWLVGGGKLVDVVRSLDANVGIPAEVSHQVSIHLMDINAKLLSPRFPGWPIVEKLTDLEFGRSPSQKPQHSKRASNFLLQPSGLIDELEKRPIVIGLPKLPSTWEVTSDSIATWLGIHLNAFEVVLLKSCAVDSDDIESLTKSKIIDGHLKHLKFDPTKMRVACHCLND
jgi:aspartokinase-like uncharacterized kinase